MGQSQNTTLKNCAVSKYYISKQLKTIGDNNPPPQKKGLNQKDKITNDANLLKT